MLRYLTLPLIFALSACQADETLSGYGAAGVTWRLTSLDGAAFSARATLEFPEPGKISGAAPCNRYFGAQTAPYPWFKIEGLGRTKRACPELAQESAYFSALSEMTLSEVTGATLILSNDAGREMLFTAAPSAQ